MPWTEVKPMEQKILFIADFWRRRYSLSELCRQYGISRKTGYKWVERYRLDGADGLHDQSRKPKNCPHRTPYVIRKDIIALRKKGHPAFGPKKIKILLARKYHADEIPSLTTIYNLLRQEGLIAKRKTHRHITRYDRPVRHANEPNDVWTADYKGQFAVGTSQWCYPLTVLDDKSRYLLACKALRSTNTEDAKREFERLFNEYGLPERILTDNGVPFASTSVGGLSQLSVWWLRLGITPERIEPGKPQQNGRHERMHKTLKEGTTLPIAQNFAEQQERFDEFVDQYNNERPHEGLSQQTPASQYVPSSRQMPGKLPEIEYPGYFLRCKAKNPGLIYLKGKTIYVGSPLSGEIIGLEEIDDGLWDVYFNHKRLGSFDERDQGERANGYLTINCNPCT